MVARDMGIGSRWSGGVCGGMRYAILAWSEVKGFGKKI